MSWTAKGRTEPGRSEKGATEDGNTRAFGSSAARCPQFHKFALDVWFLFGIVPAARSQGLLVRACGIVTRPRSNGWTSAFAWSLAEGGPPESLAESLAGSRGGRFRLGDQVED